MLPTELLEEIVKDANKYIPKDKQLTIEYKIGKFGERDVLIIGGDNGHKLNITHTLTTNHQAKNRLAKKFIVNMVSEDLRKLGQITINSEAFKGIDFDIDKFKQNIRDTPLQFLKDSPTMLDYQYPVIHPHHKYIFPEEGFKIGDGVSYKFGFTRYKESNIGIPKIINNDKIYLVTEVNKEEDTVMLRDNDTTDELFKEKAHKLILKIRMQEE